MERFRQLAPLLDHVWTYLEEAAADPEHPGRTPTFATTGPAVRTVVLRRADRSRRRLAFHTDRRSRKVEDLERRSDACLHIWDASRRQQLRARGAAELHTDDAFADDVWESQPDRSLAHYRRDLAPGTPIGAPAGDDLDASHPTPRSNFAVVSLRVHLVDWLHLHPEGHDRATFEWSDGEWHATWTVP